MQSIEKESKVKSIIKNKYSDYEYLKNVLKLFMILLLRENLSYMED